MISPTHHILSKDTPSVLNLFFTGRCNLNCHYCFVNKTGWEHRTVDAKSLKRSVDILLRYPGSTKKISFLGGEPLVEFALVREIYDYALEKARKKKIILDVSVVTNGTLLTQEMADYFIQRKTKVVLSIDGAKFSHDRNRPFRTSPSESSFNKIIQNMARIKWGPLKLDAVMVFTPGNVGRLIENLRCLTEMDFQSVDFYPDLCAQWAALDLHAVKETFQKFGVYYVGLFEKNKKIFRNHIIGRLANDDLAGDIDHCGEIQLSPEKEFYVCDKVFSLSRESRKGYVVGTVAEGIANRKRKELLMRLRNDFVVDSGLGCRDCTVRKYCLCPVGHQIYASVLKAQHQQKQAKGMYRSFCFFSKIYSTTFLRICSKLKYDPRFIELYQFVAPGREELG